NSASDAKACMLLRVVFFAAPGAAMASSPGAPEQAASSEITTRVTNAETVRDAVDSAKLRIGRVKFFIFECSCLCNRSNNHKENGGKGGNLRGFGIKRKSEHSGPVEKNEASGSVAKSLGKSLSSI